MLHLSPVLLCAALLVGMPTLAHAAGPPRLAPSSLDTAIVRLGPAEAGSDAYVARPPGQGQAPVILVLHEWWGLDGHIRDVARQLARQGYVAVVPDLYHGRVTSDPDSARALKERLEPDDAFAVLDQAVRWLRAQPRTLKSRIGVVGFCMGGGLAQRYALRTRGLDALVVFYGQPETDAGKLATLQAPLQAHFGAEDRGIPLAKVDELRGALAKAGKAGEIYTYPGAGHAFMNDGRETYRPDAARQAWARMLAFLQEQLKGR